MPETDQINKQIYLKNKANKLDPNNSPNVKRQKKSMKSETKLPKHKTRHQTEKKPKTDPKSLKRIIRKVPKAERNKSKIIEIALNLENYKKKDSNQRFEDLRKKEQANELIWERMRLKEKNRDRGRGRSRRSQMGVPLKIPSVRERKNRLSRIYNWKGKGEKRDAKDQQIDLPTRQDPKSKKHPNFDVKMASRHQISKNDPKDVKPNEMIDLGTGKGFFRKMTRKEPGNGQKSPNMTVGGNPPNRVDLELKKLDAKHVKEEGNESVNTANMKKASRYRKASAKERAFRVEKVIGQGSFANVYLVTSRETK